jgi:hypothetical protein
MGQSFTKTSENHGKITPGAGHTSDRYWDSSAQPTPRRRANAETRAREYLTDTEVQKLMRAAGNNRNGHRDATMVLLA